MTSAGRVLCQGLRVPVSRAFGAGAYPLRPRPHDPRPPRRSDHLIISKPGVTPVTCLPRDCASGASCFFCSAGQPAHHRARLHRLQEQDVARQRQPQRRLARVTRVVAIACRRACIHRFVRSVALALCVCISRLSFACCFVYRMRRLLLVKTRCAFCR